VRFAVSTAALTASFVGLVALAAGDVQGATARLPALGVDDEDWLRPLGVTQLGVAAGHRHR